MFSAEFNISQYTFVVKTDIWRCANRIHLTFFKEDTCTKLVLTGVQIARAFLEFSCIIKKDRSKRKVLRQFLTKSFDSLSPFSIILLYHK